MIETGIVEPNIDTSTDENCTRHVSATMRSVDDGYEIPYYGSVSSTCL